MTANELTDLCGDARQSAMKLKGQGEMRWIGAGKAAWPAMMLGFAGLGGCINVSAPDKPIVIELNINIRQEVIYMLADEAAETIEQNADIF